MQKEDHSRELNKKLAAVCGLYCEACSLFISTAEDLERLKWLAAQNAYFGGREQMLWMPVGKEAALLREMQDVRLRG